MDGELELSGELGGTNATRMYHDLVRRDVFSLVPKYKEKLLDFGGGIGATAIELRKLGYAAGVGVIDRIPTDQQLDALDFRYCADAEDISTLNTILRREGPFNTILCLDILEHLKDPWSVIRTLHDALATDGCIVASIPNIRNFQASFPLFFQGRWDLTESGILDRTHLRFFVRKTAIELMTSSGLCLEAILPLPSGGRKIKLIRMFTFGVLNSFTDRQYLIRVRKC